MWCCNNYSLFEPSNRSQSLYQFSAHGRSLVYVLICFFSVIALVTIGLIGVYYDQERNQAISVPGSCTAEKCDALWSDTSTFIANAFSIVFLIVSVRFLTILLSSQNLSFKTFCYCCGSCQQIGLWYVWLILSIGFMISTFLAFIVNVRAGHWPPSTVLQSVTFLWVAMFLFAPSVLVAYCLYQILYQMSRGVYSLFCQGCFSSLGCTTHCLQRVLASCTFRCCSKKTDDVLECSICCDSASIPSQPFIAVQACRHHFHSACFARYMSINPHATCPLCRAFIAPNDVQKANADAQLNC